jgi:hypothetical protein
VTRLLASLAFLGALAATGAAAQDVPAVPAVELPEPRLLREGERAPFTGQLMAQDDVLLWARTIEDLRHRLELDVRTEVERCDVRLELERARTTAAAETLVLHDTLWTDRVAELTAALVEARRSAERQWYESPALWFAVGAVVTAVATVAIAASLD